MTVAVGLPILTQAQLVTNGSFSGGSIAGWTVSGSLTWYPWIAAGAGTQAYATPPPTFYDAAVNGAATIPQAAQPTPQGPTTLTQALTLTPGSQYTLSMDVATDDLYFVSSADNGIWGNINSATVLSSYNFTNDAGGPAWLHLSGNFVAAASNTLSISGYDNPAFEYVTHIAVTPVPEPFSLGAVTVGLGFMLRRKLKKS